MGDKNPKNIGKLKGQAEDKKEEALEYKHETPAEKVHNKERVDAIKETKIDAEYGEESDLPQPPSLQGHPGTHP